jgi:hypothetical protein
MTILANFYFSLRWVFDRIPEGNIPILMQWETMTGEHEEHEKLVKTTINLEEEVLEALKELAVEFSRETGQKWSRGAVIRLALSEFFSRRGKIL